jgi:hypothetical protein
MKKKIKKNLGDILANQVLYIKGLFIFLNTRESRVIKYSLWGSYYINYFINGKLNWNYLSHQYQKNINKKFI